MVYGTIFFFFSKYTESPRQKAGNLAVKAIKENNCALDKIAQELARFNDREEAKFKEKTALPLSLHIYVSLEMNVLKVAQTDQ